VPLIVVTVGEAAANATALGNKWLALMINWSAGQTNADGHHILNRSDNSSYIFVEFIFSHFRRVDRTTGFSFPYRIAQLFFRTSAPITDSPHFLIVILLPRHFNGDLLTTPMGIKHKNRK
jgi:hypothetical protein